MKLKYKNSNELIKIATTFAEEDKPFASARVWKMVVAKDPSPYPIVQCVEQMRLSGDYTTAEQLLGEIPMDKLPDEGKSLIYLRYGSLYEDQGRIDEAITAYRNCIDAFVEETYPFILLANLLSQQSKLDEVEQVLTTALEQKEGSFDEVYYHLAVNAARQNDFKKALEYINKCLEIDPDFPPAHIFKEDFETVLKFK